MCPIASYVHSGNSCDGTEDCVFNYKMGWILPPESCSATAAFLEGGMFTNTRTQTVPATLLHLPLPLLWTSSLRLRARMSAGSKKFCIWEFTKSRFLIYLGVPSIVKALASTPLWHTLTAAVPETPGRGRHCWARPWGPLVFLQSNHSLIWGNYLIVFCIIPPTLCKNIVQIFC